MTANAIAMEIKSEAMAKPSMEDVLLWPDTSWCYRSEMPGMSHMSDDFEVIPVDTERYECFLEANA